jgi:hypothetical protein
MLIVDDILIFNVIECNLFLAKEELIHCLDIRAMRNIKKSNNQGNSDIFKKYSSCKSARSAGSETLYDLNPCDMIV